MVARLAALIVNYNSGAYALGLARALRAQWREMGRDDRALELVVVDNASRAADAAPLELLRREGARVDVCDTNLGYAAGMNRALAHTQGSGGDLVLVLNPDLALFPGCLARLLATHALTPRLGALAPRAFLDPARQWRMPRCPRPRSLMDRAGRRCELFEVRVLVGCEATAQQRLEAAQARFQKPHL
jgi:GT2 family glycosyltransferase